MNWFLSMNAPGSKREGVPRGGILQIHLGRACNLACTGCTQGSQLSGAVPFMTESQFSEACRSLAGYEGIVGIFGGNPTLHPRFRQICEIFCNYFPKDQRGIWTNNLNGHGALCQETFSAEHSNFNLHLDEEAYQEFERDWPEALPYLRGRDPRYLTVPALATLQDGDARHTPPFVAMRDLIEDEAVRRRLILSCDINRWWSALIGVFRGNLRAWFCEVAYSLSVLHEKDPAWQDTGVPVVPGWWSKSIDYFESQIELCCHNCGIPLRGKGDLATGTQEYTTKTHAPWFTPKTRKNVLVVDTLDELQAGANRYATLYQENGKVK